MSSGCIFKSRLVYGRAWKYSSCGRSVAVFPDASVSVEVVGLGAFALDAGAIHGSGAAQLVVRVTPAAQTRLQGHAKRGEKKEREREVACVIISTIFFCPRLETSRLISHIN